MGAIGPKKRISKARRNKRRAQSWKIDMPNLVACSKCGEPKRSHYTCKFCGTYNKRAVVNMD